MADKVTDEQVLVYLGASNLYRKAFRVYTEAVTNNTNINKNLIDLFNSATINPGVPQPNPIFGKDLDDPATIYDFASSVHKDFKDIFEKAGQTSAVFLKGTYDFYGIDYPPEGFLVKEFGATNWWEKTTQYNHGFFSYTHVLKYELSGDGTSEKIVSGDKEFELAVDFEHKTLISSAYNFRNNVINFNPAVRNELIDNAIARYVKEKNDLDTDIDVDNELNAVTIDDNIKQNHFIILESGIHFTDTPATTGNSALVYVRVLFDTYGAKLALSNVKFTGLEPIPKIPSGIRKNFLVNNFLNGISSLDVYLKELGETNEKIELSKAQHKKLKSAFKKVVKDNKLSPDSTIAFVFSEEYKFLTLLDGNNKGIKSPELVTLLKDNVELNKTITYLNFINCQVGGNALGDTPEVKEISYPFSLDEDSSTPEQRKSQYDSLNSKSEFTGDVSLRSILRAGAPSTVADMYDQFLNKVDIHALSKFAKSSLASALSDEQLKRVKLEAYINSLDITEIVDCIVETAGDPYSADLKLAVYDTFSFFYNAAKTEDPELFNFITRDKRLPIVNDEGFDMSKSFPYILMVPEKQRTKIFSTIVNNNSQWMYIGPLNGVPTQQEVDSNPLSLGRPSMKEINKQDAFVPEKFITYALRNRIINYSKDFPQKVGSKAFTFDDFYSELAKKNKKLQEDFSASSLLSDGDYEVYKTQQSSNTKTNKAPSFDWYSAKEPTLDHIDSVSGILEDAFEAAMLTILSQIIDSLITGAEKQMSGDPDKLNKADPAVFALVASNDPVENIIDSKNNNFNSSQDVVAALSAALFPGEDPAKVKCFLENFASEVNLFTQAKLFKNPTKINDPDIEVVRNILIRCGLPSDNSTITNLLLRFSQLIDKDLLELKLKEMNAALLEYLDICDDPNQNYIENLKKFLSDQDAKSQAANESESAAKKLADLLALLDGDKIKDMAPKLFCKLGSGDKAVFDNQYSDITLDSQDDLMMTTLQEINVEFNNDIAKFKPLILKQDDANPLSKLGLVTPSKEGASLSDFGDIGKFLEDINNNKIDNNEDKPTYPEPGKYNVIESTLSNFAENYLLFNQEFSKVGSTSSGVLYFRFDFSKIRYIMLFNTNEEATDIWYGGKLRLRLKKRCSSVVAYNTASGAIIIPENVGNIESYATTESPLELDDLNEKGDTLEIFKKLFTLSYEGGVSFPANYLEYLRTKADAPNIALKVAGILGGWSDSDYLPDADFSIEGAGLTTVQLVKEVLENKNMYQTNFMKSIFQNIFSGVLAKVIDSLQLFDDKTFSDIPFKDTEAANIFNDSRKLFRDKGLMSASEIFQEFSTLRENLQCFIASGSSPDTYQVSKLILLYQSLFNVLIVQQFLSTFFSLFVEEDTFAFSKDQVKKIIVSGVAESFDNRVMKIDNFHLNYEKDLKMIYKYEQLQNGLATKEVKGHTTNQIIEFYVDKFYNIILDKLQKRFSLSSFKSVVGDISTEGNILPAKPLPLYTSVQPSINNWITTEAGKYKFDYTDIPIYTYNEEEEGKKLYNGLIVQTYYDIRQKLNVKETFQVPTGELTKDDVPVMEEKELYSYWWHTYKFKNGAPDKSEYESIISNYTDIPDGQIDMSVGPLGDKTSEHPELFGDYKKYFLRTQGKISVKDFERWYKEPRFLYGMAATDEGGETKMVLNPDKGPKDYFDKFSVGARVCLVMDDTDETAKKIRDISREYLLAKNDKPKLDDASLEKQIKSFLAEKIFRYKITGGSYKIVVPIGFYEFDSLSQIQDNDYDDNEALQAYFDGDDNVNPTQLISWYWHLINLSSIIEKQVLPSIFDLEKVETDFQEGSLQHEAFVAARTELVDPIINSMPAGLFDNLLPLAIRYYLNEEYGELEKLFNPTVSEIIGQISLAKSVINKDWKSELVLSTEDPFAGDFSIGTTSDNADEFSYLPYVLSALVLIIQTFATYQDPTWKTPWFFPGPQQPIGYLAKILGGGI